FKANQSITGVSNAVAIGKEAQAYNSGDVALGAGSKTDTQHTGRFSLNNVTVAGLTSGAAVVSVGSGVAERQIQNVAPGVISSSSTDAINGSQLYATNKFLGMTDDGSVEYNGNKYDSLGDMLDDMHWNLGVDD